MASSLDLLRAQLSNVLANVAANLPQNYKLTLVARYVGPLDADIVLTEDHPLKAADALTKLHAQGVADATKIKVAEGGKAYLVELGEDAKRRLPDGYAFAILVCPFGDGQRRFRHTCSCDRRSLIAWMREYADVLEKTPEAFDGHPGI